MRIVQIIPSLIKGGAERLALDITRELSSRPNTEVRLIYFNNIHDYQHEYADVNSELLDIGVTPSVFGKWDISLKQWKELLDEFKPDVIHSHLFAADLVSRFNIRPNIRYFSHFHDNMHQIRSFSSDFTLSKYRLTDYYERNFLVKRYRESKNTFISISPDTTLYFKRNLPNDLTKRIIEIPNAIDFQKFSQRRTTSPDDITPLRILNVGSFVPKKNQSFLVKIASLLKSMNLNFEIRFAGDGPKLEEVRVLSNKLGVSENITFLGNVEHIEEEMNRSHIYVHTANYEPFGLVLLEAMASGLPVITLDGKGNRKLIIDGETGFFIENENTAIFVNKILALKRDNLLWKKLSSGGKAFAKKFDIRNYGDKLLSIYTSGV